MKMAGTLSLILVALFVTLAVAQTSPFKRWDGVQVVPNDAFSAGLDCSGKKIYIGRVKINSIAKPGRLYFQNSGTRKAGIYVQDAGAQCFRNKYVDYFVNDPKCSYAWVESSNGAVVSNAVLTNGPGSFYVGRAFVNKCLTVGRVVVGDKMYYSPNNSATKYKVLVCNPVTAPPTQAPAPTEAPPGCTLTCANGVLDSANCRCCDFADASRYLTLKSDLANLEAQAAGNTKMQSQVNTLKQNIADIENSVIGTCGSRPPDTVSGYFEIFGQNLQKLNLTLREFEFQFASGVCALSCDEANNYAPDRKKCKCMYLEGFGKLMGLAGFNSYFNALIRTTYDISEFYTFLEQYQTVYNSYWNLVSRIKYQWGSYTLEQKYGFMSEVVTRTIAFNSNASSYINTIPGSCGNVCERYTIPEVANACQCDNSSVVIDFFNSFEQFLVTENEIRSTDFKSFTDDKTRFQDWAKEVRRKATVFFNGIAVDGFSAEQKQAAYNEYYNDWIALKTAWEAFKPNLTAAPCTATCSGDTVKTCNPCECAAVSGYDNLLNVIYPDLSAIQAEIDALTADESYKTTLKNNANTILSGIEQIKSLNCYNVVVANVRNGCNQLTSMYAELKTQIIEVKNSAASGGCSVTCPNERYIKDLAACSCTCLPFTCDAATQNADSYNCQCVPK